MITIYNNTYCGSRISSKILISSQVNPPSQEKSRMTDSLCCRGGGHCDVIELLPILMKNCRYLKRSRWKNFNTFFHYIICTFLENIFSNNYIKKWIKKQKRWNSAIYSTTDIQTRLLFSTEIYTFFHFKICTFLENVCSNKYSKKKLKNRKGGIGPSRVHMIY